MPWKVSKGHGCPASKPWAVVKETTGEKVACHATHAKAAAQVRALYANEKHADSDFASSSGSTKLPFNVRFKEAARFFAAKVPLTRDEFDQLSDWAKTRAFTVATVTKAELLQDVQDAVGKAIDDGLTLADFRSILGDVMESRGWGGLTPWHAETVFRTNIQSAYGIGRLQQQRDQRDDFPFLQYHAIHDSRTRPSHLALDGVVRPIGDPFWKKYYPPWAYNCRCDAESLTADEARAIGVAPVNILGEPEGDFTSPGASDEYDPDLSGLGAALRAKVQKMLDQFDPSSVTD